MPREVQRFEVSLKAFIVRNGCALLVREADSGWWELPGGRIDVGEEWARHADVLSREVREELGPDLSLTYATEAVTWTRRRPTDGVFLFIVARPAFVGAGEPVLSDEHSEFAWVRPEAAACLPFPPESGYADGLAALWRLTQSRAGRGGP